MSGGDDDRIVLLDAWASSFGMRVRIALAEKGIEYDGKEEDLMNKSSVLLEMNPVHKKIPVLIHNGKPICESVVIVEYIDEAWKHKAPPLLPTDPYHRAMAKFWVHYVDDKIPNNIRSLWLKKGEEQEKAKEELIECLKTMEGELGDKPFFGGERLGLVDIALVPFYSWFYTIETIGKFNVEAKCPKIIRWAKRCMEKESVSKSLPDPHKIYEYLLLRLKKHLGTDQ